MTKTGALSGEAQIGHEAQTLPVDVASLLRSLPAPPAGWPDADAGIAEWIEAGVEPESLLRERAWVDLKRGAVLTPTALAHLVAARLVWHARASGALPTETQPRVLDPAVGTGALLWALRAHLGAGTFEGVDIEERSIEQAQSLLDDPTWRMRVGDGLAVAPDPRCNLVIMNPPFLGEKGNKDLFRRLKQGPWADFVGARADLLYPFLALGVSCLRPGGWMACITSAYWPTASGANAVRAFLLAQTDVAEILDLGALRPFDGAKGLHTLVSFFRKKSTPRFRSSGMGLSAPTSSTDPNGDGLTQVFKLERKATLHDLSSALFANTASASGSVASTVVSLRSDTKIGPNTGATGASWHIHRPRAVSNALEILFGAWPRLSEFALDRQGVVSGLDEAFLISGARYGELTDGETDAWWLRPLVRGSEIHAFVDPVEGAQRLWLLYLRGDREPPEHVRAHLEPFRERLSSRREVRSGARLWWALTWPRHLTIEGPKIVCPRRAKAAAFGFVSSGELVSSDCTFLTLVESANKTVAHTPLFGAMVFDGPESGGDNHDAHDGETERGVQSQETLERRLRSAAQVLNSSVVDLQLQHNGKRKGRQIELYAQPLREVRVPLDFVKGYGVEVLIGPETPHANLASSASSLGPVNDGKLREFQKKMDAEIIEKALNTLEEDGARSAVAKVLWAHHDARWET